jgi:uncharacterized membrane protein YecN with MAPEG domain
MKCVYACTTSLPIVQVKRLQTGNTTELVRFGNILVVIWEWTKCPSLLIHIIAILKGWVLG